MRIRRTAVSWPGTFVSNLWESFFSIVFLIFIDHPVNTVGFSRERQNIRDARAFGLNLTAIDDAGPACFY